MTLRAPVQILRMFTHVCTLLLYDDGGETKSGGGGQYESAPISRRTVPLIGSGCRSDVRINRSMVCSGRGQVVKKERTPGETTSAPSRRSRAVNR